ncbi:MAG: SMC-Scp complex subunit ScpB [Parcubacteria group bacterium]|jgi:segregation and condensation protein B
MDNVEQKVEAALFTIGDPVSLKKLAAIVTEKEESVEKAIASLKEKYRSPENGIYLVEHDSGIQLVTKPELSSVIEKLVKAEIHENLTPAALETLSLVAYLGPISKSSLEYIRGVNSSFTLRNLLIRGLVERISHPKKSNAYLYRPTADLLRHLGLAKKEELPDFMKYQELKEIMEKENE